MDRGRHEGKTNTTIWTSDGDPSSSPPPPRASPDPPLTKTFEMGNISNLLKQFQTPPLPPQPGLSLGSPPFFY